MLNLVKDSLTVVRGFNEATGGQQHMAVTYKETVTGTEPVMFGFVVIAAGAPLSTIAEKAAQITF